MSELYELPAGWEWKTIDEFATIKSGKRVPKGKKLLDNTTPYPYIRVTDFSDNGTVDSTDIKYITEEIYQQIKNYTITDEDIYISVAGTIGKTGIIPSSLNGANLTENAVKIVFDNSKYDKNFIFNFTNSITFMEQIGLATKTVAMPKLAIKRLKEVYIPLPPLPEQQRIVSKLDLLFEKIDKSIALHQKNMDEANAFMGSVLNDVFEMEKVLSWNKYQFDHISKFIDYRGKTPTKTESGIPLITAKNVRFGYLSENPIEYIAEEAYTEWMSRGIPTIGDVIFTTEAPLGNVCLLNTNKKRAFAQRIVTFKQIKNDTYVSEFLFYYLMSSFFRDELFNKSTGTTVKGIKTSILKKFNIYLPPLPIQQKTVTYLDEISQKIEKIKQLQKKKMASLKALKASILDSAFRGEL